MAASVRLSWLRPAVKLGETLLRKHQGEPDGGRAGQRATDRAAYRPRPWAATPSPPVNRGYRLLPSQAAGGPARPWPGKSSGTGILTTAFHATDLHAPHPRTQRGHGAPLGAPPRRQTAGMGRTRLQTPRAPRARRRRPGERGARALSARGAGGGHPAGRRAAWRAELSGPRRRPSRGPGPRDSAPSEGRGHCEGPRPPPRPRCGRSGRRKRPGPEGSPRGPQPRPRPRGSRGGGSAAEHGPDPAPASPLGRPQSLGEGAARTAGPEPPRRRGN